MIRIGWFLVVGVLFSCEDGPKSIEEDTFLVEDSADPDTSDSAPMVAEGEGYSAQDDCDDDNAEVNPGATETCDEVDNDCDGEVDEDDAEDVSTWYFDYDGDGYGDEAYSLDACDAPDGYVPESGEGFDCDDTDEAFHPGASEDDCTDPSDYNCDGSVSYEDLDEDGWPACEDCDDSVASINPDGTEACDGVDNDCDEEVDEDDAEDVTTWYLDSDGDEYGDEAYSVVSCDAPDGYVEESSEGFDCDDDDEAYHPGATEDDCSDASDYNCDGSVSYEDEDEDGWPACEECDDSDPDVYPGAEDAWYDGVDSDCEENSDYDADADGYDSDGYEVDGEAGTDCWDNPEESVSAELDADEVNPAATEVCDELDNDCDGTIDEGDAEDSSSWYADTDEDGFGDPDVSAGACEVPTGYVANDSDCDDSESTIHPDADEVCDGVDNDCDDDIDDDDSGVTGTST
ncbi:MAG: MopE-related protein, partial [Myxococcota bacterium]|nr:MopE-related protein [Myxococcota bacterium]